MSTFPEKSEEKVRPEVEVIAFPGKKEWVIFVPCSNLQTLTLTQALAFEDSGLNSTKEQGLFLPPHQPQSPTLETTSHWVKYAQHWNHVETRP
jgi:hypothetical protein